MKNKPKIVSVAWSYHKHMQDMAPEESYHLHLLKVAKEIGYQPYIILKDGREFLDTDAHLDKDIIIIDYKNVFYFFFQILKLSIQNSLFYVNSYEWQSFVIPFIARKTIFMAHTQPKRNSKLKQKIQNFVYTFFSAIRLNNSTEKEFLLTQEIDPSKLHIIPLVVSQDVFKLTNHNPETRKNLVYFGNITAKKDVLTIIKAFEKVKKLRHEVQLNIIGNMWDKQVVEYAQKSAFSLDIIFHGFLDNDAVVQKLNENMLYINSSLDEGQCVAVYDAALCGLGLCLPNIMSFVDVYKDKALFHNVGDDTSLSQNILYYLDNPDIIQHHNQKNIEMIKKEYSIEAVEGKLKLLLSKFI